MRLCLSLAPSSDLSRRPCNTPGDTAVAIPPYIATLNGRPEPSPEPATDGKLHSPRHPSIAGTGWGSRRRRPRSFKRDGRGCRRRLGGEITELNSHSLIVVGSTKMNVTSRNLSPPPLPLLGLRLCVCVCAGVFFICPCRGRANHACGFRTQSSCVRVLGASAE